MTTPRRLLVALAALALAFAVTAAAATDDAGAVPFDSPRWSFDGDGHRLEEHLGRPALFLHGSTAVLGDVALLDGVLEVDVAFRAERGFSGVLWRRQGPGDHEELYGRPHQSGNPDANQYTPSFHGLTAWQLYYGPSYATPVHYRFDAWQRMRIVFAGRRAALYLDSEEPILIIPELKRAPRAGAVGVFASRFAPAWFSDFRVRPLRPGEGVPEGGTPPPPAPPGSVLEWQVSTAFDGARLAGRLDVPADLAAELAWTPLAAESSGITNLARLQGVSEKIDTAFARVAVSVDRPTRKRFTFGYSDDVKLYVDGRLVYGGSNRYLSRDYRYLGTIGLFHEVYLDLAPGDHEVCLAVTEGFGGWGVQATLEDL